MNPEGVSTGMASELPATVVTNEQPVLRTNVSNISEAEASVKSAGGADKREWRGEETQGLFESKQARPPHPSVKARSGCDSPIERVMSVVLHWSFSRLVPNVPLQLHFGSASSGF